VKTVEQRFWDKVGPHGDPSKCWIWMAATIKAHKVKYGVFYVVGRQVMAHRFAYEMHHHVTIPKGMTIDHVKARGCTNTLCVNPYHLEVVTCRVNILRGSGFAAIKAKQTHCIHGHPLTEGNIYVYPSSPGSRKCRICSIERSRERKKGVQKG